MNFPNGKTVFLAGLFGLPLLGHAENFPFAQPSRDLTLLTGPYLLSPASPPASPVSGQEWTFVKGTGRPAPANAAGGGTLVLSGQPKTHFESGPSNESASMRLQRLEAQRTEALSRKKELDELKTKQPGRLELKKADPTALPADPIRFDAKMPATPRLQLQQPVPAAPPL